MKSHFDQFVPQMARRLAALSLLPLALCLTFAAEDAFAQTASVRGFVTDDADGQALQGVNVALLDAAGGLITGTATSSDGLYFIAQVEPGTFTIRVSFVGYATITDTLTLAPGEIRSLNFRIGASEADLDEVVVETGASGWHPHLSAVPRTRVLLRIPVGRTEPG